MPTFPRSLYYNNTRRDADCTGTIHTHLDDHIDESHDIPQPSTPSVTPTPSSPSPSITQSTTTQPNGSVVIQTIIVTPSPSNTIAADDHDGSSPDFAPIVGGTVGGFFGLIAIVALIWFILRRRRRWDDIFEREENEIIAAGARGRPARFSLDVDPEPKPYQYGLIGKVMAPSASPPNSPSMRPSAGTGNIHHARHSSLTPLNPVTASNATLSSSRPSTGGSQQPLYPPQQGYTQGYVPPLPQHQPTIDYASGPSTLTHNHSASTASFTSAPVSHAHWGNGVGPGYNDSIGTAMMGLGSPVMIPDETDRSGTPTSYQEPRRLQVTNAIPSEFDFEFGESSSSAAAAAAAAAVPLRDGKGRLVTRTPVQPIVHVDGGRVELNNQPAVAPPSASGPLPPAYAN
ncbi:hypothetical protein H0H87_003179 [Tephrocybe sp. NHM501043]|nr:hypothetical protein H0H87_003179 [Tephrocybe sp. NHM501043]